MLYYVNVHEYSWFVFSCPFPCWRTTILPEHVCQMQQVLPLLLLWGGQIWPRSGLIGGFRMLRIYKIYYIYIYVCYQVTTVTMLPFILSEMILGAEITSQGARIRLISLFCIWGSIIPLSHAIQLKAYGICPTQRKNPSAKTLRISEAVSRDLASQEREDLASCLHSF